MTGAAAAVWGGVGEPAVAVVVVSWNTRELLRACLRSLREHATALPMEVWVVDNASEDGSAAMVEADFPDVHLIRNEENLGFAQANNQALARTRAQWLVLLNSDAEVTAGALDAAIETSARTRRVVAGKLLNPDGTLQHSCFRFPSLAADLLEAVYLHRLLPRAVRGRLLRGGYWDHERPGVVDWALGAFLVVPRAAYLQAGPLPEEHFVFGEDVEWCWRFHEAGYGPYYAPEALVVHHGNQSAEGRGEAWRIASSHAETDRFLAAHYGAWEVVLLKAIRLLGYRVRTLVLRLIGRRDDADRYGRIVRVLSGPGEDDGS